MITVGEMLALAAQREWSSKTVAILKQIAEQLVVVDVRNQTVLEKYAEIDAFLVRNGRKIGDNDIWIAATAAAAGAILLTCDKDFDPLNDVFLTRIYFDPNVST